MYQPKISIVTISYNQGEFLKECLSSVASQSYENYEHIVVDDGSTDNSRDIILGFKDKVIPIFKKNSGPADSLNKGFEIAKGEIFGYINSDDYLLKNTLNDVRDLFGNFSNCDVIYGNGYIVDRNSRFKERMFSKEFSMNNYRLERLLICQQATFFRKKCYFSVGGFNIENNRSWDFELFADMYNKKFKFKKVDNFLGAFRIYSGSLTGKFILKDRTVSIFHHKRMYKKYFSSEKNYLDHFLIAFSYIFDRLFNLKFIFRKIYDYYFSIRGKRIN